MNKIPNNGSHSKMLLVWIPVLLILYIKSSVVLFSLYSLNPVVFLFGIISITPTLFLLSFSFLFSEKGQLFYLFALDLFISVLFIVDMVYARAYGHLISVYMIIAKGVLKDLNASVISLMKWSDFLILVDLPVLCILAIRSKEKTRVKKRIYLFFVTALLSIVVICFQFTNLENNKSLGNYKLHPLLMSPIGNHMFDLYRFFYEKKDNLDKKDIAAVNGWLEENKKYQKPANEYSNLKGLLKGKNLIVIHFESLENVVVGKSYYGQEITPNINKLIKNSIYFNNIFEQVRDGNSSDAELMFNTSIYPLSSGSAFLRFGENSYVSLPKLLQEDGYTSIAIHGDDKEFWNRSQVFPVLGFERFITQEQFDDKSNIGMGISDKSLFSQSILEIKKLKEPYNFFIITLTSHMPFSLEKKDQTLDLKNKNNTTDYLQSIHYSDKFLGEFYEKLKEEGLLKNTALVIYGDHEGVHKYYPSTTLQNNNYKLPFIVHIPGMKGFESNKIGGQVDMMPTLAYLLGIDEKKYFSSVMGRNLLGSASGTVVLPTGKILGKADDETHLMQAQSAADMIIRGNYFNSKKTLVGTH